MDTIILLLSGSKKSGKCGMACSRNMTSRVGATGMWRIKSPECLGADLPKERNLRVFPELFICRLSSRSHLAKKVESPRVLRNTSSGSSRRSISIHKKSFNAAICFWCHSPLTGAHTCKMNARAPPDVKSKLGRGKNRASSSLPACSLGKNARELRYLKASAADVRRAINYSAQTTAGEAHKKKTQESICERRAYACTCHRLEIHSPRDSALLQRNEKVS
jgi:hypothetical protein